MTFLNIEIETNNLDADGNIATEEYYIQLPYTGCADDLWLDVEDKLDNDFVDSVIDCEVGEKGKGKEIKVSVQDLIDLREEEERLELEAATIED